MDPLFSSFYQKKCFFAFFRGENEKYFFLEEFLSKLKTFLKFDPNMFIRVKKGRSYRANKSFAIHLILFEIRRTFHDQKKDGF